jgi:hypothetical protein
MKFLIFFSGKTNVFIENLWTPTGEYEDWFKVHPKGALHLKFKVAMAVSTPENTPTNISTLPSVQAPSFQFLPHNSPSVSVGNTPKKPPKVFSFFYNFSLFQEVDEFTDGSVVALDWHRNEVDHVTYNLLSSNKIPGVLKHKGDNFGGVTS